MHVPTILYGYNVQAFRLPFMTQHSPSLQWMIPTTMEEQQWQDYNTGGQRRKALLLWVQHPKATNLLKTTHLPSRARRILLPP